MKQFARIAGILGLVLTTSACVTTTQTAQNGATESRSFAPATVNQAELATDNVLVAAAPFGYDVVDVAVVVPEYLVVSEADVYLPHADIVWREDPLGDRRAQVGEILKDALRLGSQDMAGQRKVILAAQLATFHALTEKARETTGGKHNVQFDFVLLDAETRVPVTEARRVDASLRAFGGRRAYEAMREGQTQRVRITNHVADIIRQEIGGSSRS